MKQGENRGKNKQKWKIIKKNVYLALEYTLPYLGM